MLPLWDTQPRRRPPVIVPWFIALNLTVFGYELWLLLQGGRALEIFLWEHALVPARLLEGWTDGRAWLTVLTSMFLHGSGAHVLGNCWFLWVFGGGVEARIGPGRFVVLYLSTGIGAAGLQFITEPGSIVPMLGASGAISGILGAYFVLFPRTWIVTLVPWIVPIVPVPAFVFLILWFVLQTVSGVGAFMDGPTEGGGVAWWAHIGGFVAGVFLIRLLGRARGRWR